jgi:hypothetical protein
VYLLIGAVILWVVPVFVAVGQGNGKNRAGLAYGLFLGWLGVIILAFLPPRADERYGECPYCRENVRHDATVCPHCRRALSPVVTSRRGSP